MSKNNISSAQYLNGKLRSGVYNGDIIDYNAANRAGTFGNWIYPDHPKIVELLKNKHNFPRISVETRDVSTIKRLGIQSTQYHEMVQLSINVWSPPNLVCEIKNVATEDHTYATGTDIYELDTSPVSILGSTIDGTESGVPYSFTKGTDYELTDSAHDGFSNAVKWLGVTLPDDGTTFTVAYNRKALGEELNRIIAKDVMDYIRTNWLTWFSSDQLLSYWHVVSAKPIVLDEYENIHRYEIFCNFKYLTGNEI